MLEIAKPLDDKIVKENTELVILIEATATDLKTGKATLVLEIEKDASSSIKFKEVLYKADYPTTGTRSIDLGIGFEDNLDESNVNIVIDSKLKKSTRYT